MPGLLDGTMLGSSTILGYATGALIGNATGALVGFLEGIIDTLIGVGARLGSCGKIVGDRVESFVRNAFGIADGCWLASIMISTVGIT